MEKFLGSIKIKFISPRKGQMAIEAVLLMTILVSVFLLILKFTQGSQGTPPMLQRLVSKPVIDKFRTITSFGTWNSDGCTAPGKAKQTLGKCHPNSIQRSLSSDPG